MKEKAVEKKVKTIVRKFTINRSSIWVIMKPIDSRGVIIEPGEDREVCGVFLSLGGFCAAKSYSLADLDEVEKMVADRCHELIDSGYDCKNYKA